jgi:hypothetical protein
MGRHGVRRAYLRVAMNNHRWAAAGRLSFCHFVKKPYWGGAAVILRRSQASLFSRVVIDRMFFAFRMLRRAVGK